MTGTIITDASALTRGPPSRRAPHPAAAHSSEARANRLLMHGYRTLSINSTARGGGADTIAP